MSEEVNLVTGTPVVYWHTVIALAVVVVSAVYVRVVCAFADFPVLSDPVVH